MIFFTCCANKALAELVSKKEKDKDKAKSSCKGFVCKHRPKDTKERNWFCRVEKITRYFTAPPPPPSNFSAAFFDKMCGTCHDICSVLLRLFAELVVTFLYSAFLTKSNGRVFKPLQFLHPVRRHVSHGFLILPAKFEVTHFCDKM